MENTCKLELEINWPLLEKKDNFNLREIKMFFKKALNLPYLKLENDKMWVGEPESITALVSVIEKKPWFHQYVKKCIFYDNDGSSDNILKNYGQ